MPCEDAAMRCVVCELAMAQPFQRVGARDYWRCAHCEATFLDPAQRPTPQAERAEYELHRNAVDDPAYRSHLARLTQPLLKRLAPTQRGLDYGCGPGPALAHMLRQAGHDMALYDPLFFDDAAVLAARYDFVTCTEVVEHFHHPARAFERLNALVRPGGWLALMTAFQTDDAAFAGWHYRRDPTHVVFYRPRTFEVLAVRHGWRCEIPCRNVVLLQTATD